jgi:tetratricopeptide (TPR) repeat protein
VRDAFNSAKPIGADYVSGIFHSANPFTLREGPFLSHYSGYLFITSPGTYGFMTGSQDASWLLIDGKVVVSAPGRHSMARQVKPGMRADIHLTAGAHAVDYYHAAVGSEAIMAVAWQVSPPKGEKEKPKPDQIPPEIFHAAAAVHVVAESLVLKSVKYAPDFMVRIEGEVPLPDNDVPVVGVQFHDTSAKALTMKSKIQWDFGDGQTSVQADPRHVYLRPGMYSVKLIVTRTPKNLETVNRVYVDKPIEHDKENLATLEDYLPLVEKYDPHTLDAMALRQLWAMYEAKAAALEAPPEEPAEGAAPKAPPPKRSRHHREVENSATPETPKGLSDDQVAMRHTDATRYIALAVEACKTPFVEESAAQGDEDLYALVQAVGPAARDRLGKSDLAFDIWRGAARKIKRQVYRADCAATAADVAINDLLRLRDAKRLLDDATSALGDQKNGAIGSNVYRTWGDYYGATGDGKAARKSYEEAEAVFGSNHSFAERTARRGARDRSTEDYLVDYQWDRAAAEIHQWQQEFPMEKLDGQINYMYARYWNGRQLYKQAVAQADQLVTVSPDSPFVDKTLFIAAACELKGGSPDRALAILYSLKNDYPGSPLIPQVKERIKQLETKGAKVLDKPAPRDARGK